MTHVWPLKSSWPTTRTGTQGFEVLGRASSISLLLRNPEVISNIRDHILKIWDVGLQSTRQEYDPTKYKNVAFDDYFAQNHAAVPHIDAAEFLRGVMDNDRVGGVGDTVFKMYWNVVRLNKSDQLLMTSDRPTTCLGWVARMLT
jgi:hypothetical protein